MLHVQTNLLLHVDIAIKDQKILKDIKILLKVLSVKVEMPLFKQTES